MQSVCRTGIFIICAQVLVHFRPNKSYEKYLKMLVSTMILMQLFLPVGSFLTGSGEKSLSVRITWFQERLQESMEQAADAYEERERQTDLILRRQAESVLPSAGTSNDAAENGSKDSENGEIYIDRIRIPPAGKIEIPSVTRSGKEEAADGTDTTYQSSYRVLEIKKMEEMVWERQSDHHGIGGHFAVYHRAPC